VSSLFPLLLLTACASDPVVLSDPEIVEIEKRVRVEVPAALLQPCQVSPLPFAGATWKDVFILMKQKDLEQQACNKRFETIRSWQEGTDQ